MAEKENFEWDKAACVFPGQADSLIRDDQDYNHAWLAIDYVNEDGGVGIWLNAIGMKEFDIPHFFFEDMEQAEVFHQMLGRAIAHWKAQSGK